MKISQATLLDAVRNACIWNVNDMNSGASGATSDFEAAHMAGASTSEVAFFARVAPYSITGRLDRLANQGFLIKLGSNKVSHRWWPFNLFHEINK